MPFFGLLPSTARGGRTKSGGAPSVPKTIGSGAVDSLSAAFRSTSIRLPLSLCIPKTMSAAEAIVHELLPASAAAAGGSVAIDLLAGTVSGWAQVMTGQPVSTS